MIAIYSKTFDEHCARTVRRLLEILTQTGTGVSLYRPLYDYLRSLPEPPANIAGTFRGHDDFPPETQYMISAGGDGTFLNTISIIRDSGIPVIGINTGRLGFLAHIADSDMQKSVEQLLAGTLPIEERTLIHATFNGQPDNIFPCALNDAVIHKSNSGLITIHTWSNSEYINSYWADGLIISTPTGSSAYSLSAGGPVVAPRSQNFIISPIAAHNLNVRPLIIPDSETLTLVTECRGGTDRHFTLSLDSRSVECPNGTSIELKRAAFTLKIVKPVSFYTTLRSKLMWGIDKRN